MAIDRPNEPERPVGTEGAAMEWGSDVVAEVLRRLDIPYIAMVPGARPGDFAQAMMDLGATLCTRSRPACLAWYMAASAAWSSSSGGHAAVLAMPTLALTCTVRPPMSKGSSSTASIRRANSRRAITCAAMPTRAAWR